MCAPNKRNRLPKATAIPDRKVLIHKCGEYESDCISERLKTHGPYPIMLPETQILLLSSVSDRPIETKARFKEGEAKRKKQDQDQRRNVNKQAKKNRKLLKKGPLVSCNQKDCCCQELVFDEDAQARIRTNYVELMTRSECNEIGNVLLMTYIIVKKLNDFRKSYAYEVTFLNDTGEKTGSFSLCTKNFCALFGFGLSKLTILQKRKLDPHKSVTVEIKKKTSKKAAAKQIVHDDLTAVLETEPRETSHYALNDANKQRKYFYRGGLSIFLFWLKYLKIYGNADDKKFLKQGKEKHFYSTYHYKKRVKKNPGFTDDDPMLSPSVSYESARKYWSRYDIKFQSRKCDLCEKCFSLRSAMNATTITPEERTDNKKLLFDHQKSAHLTIFVRRQWSRFVATKGFKAEHICIDYGANPRCPYMELGQAFYNRILGVNFFIITSSLKEQTYIYMYDEQTARKGSDEVISMLAMWLFKHLPPDILELLVHCDGSMGQAWNNRLPLFLEEILDVYSSK